MQATHPQSDARDRRPDPPGKHARWGVPRCAVGFEVWPPQGQGLEKSPYVSLLDPDPDIKRLRGAEDVVIKRDNIHVGCLLAICFNILILSRTYESLTDGIG